MERDQRHSATLVLGSTSLVSIGTLVGVVGACIGGSVWVTRLDARQARVEETTKEIKEDLASLSQSIDVDHEGFVRTETLDLLLQVMKARNPTLDIPELPRRR